MDLLVNLKVYTLFETLTGESYKVCDLICNQPLNFTNSIMSSKLLTQGFLYHKLRKTFAKFYNWHFDLVKQFNSSLINLIEGAISHPHFDGDFLKKNKKKNTNPME